MNVIGSRDNCYINPKDDNYLRNFKTVNGERGTLENLKDLLYLEGNLRRNFVSFIVGIAATRHSELLSARNYKFLMENGLSMVPPEDKHERAKGTRSRSNHRSKSKSKYRKGGRDSSKEDLRDKLDCQGSRGRR